MFKALSNMKIKKRLILCFIIVVIMASISGILGTVLLLRADSDYSVALVENGFSQGDIGAFDTNLNKGGALVRDIILLDDEADKQETQQQLSEVAEETNQTLANVKENCQSAEELQYISIIDEKLPKYRELRDQVIELGLENKNNEALELFRTQAGPVLDEIMSATDSLRELNTSMGTEVSDSLTAQSRVTVFIIIAVILVAAGVSIGFAAYIAKGVAEPILSVQEASGKMAAGELDIYLKVETKDEIGDMARAFMDAATMLREYIEDINRGLGEISKGNFDISSNVDFKGDFKAIESAMTTISVSLSDTLKQIDEASSQVAMGAEQMSQSAQSLAEGATDQAGAVEELTATIENVASGAETSAENAALAYKQAIGFEEEAEQGNDLMKQLLSAMERINDTSKQIENIIAEIEDIASQTNLLSLNASIEAARAGEAGRGFAVVADQIGKLASDSAKSAVNTRNLIGTTIAEIDNGNHMTMKTSEALEQVIAGIKLLAKSCKETSEQSQTQADTMKQVEQGVEQISNVVQSNSAAAEETSATSEELSAQSENLKALVEQFNLRD